jgi:hypothetical protein
MVDLVLLAASFTLELCHHSSRETLTRTDNEPNLFRGTTQSGLDLEKEPRPPVEANFFS